MFKQPKSDKSRKHSSYYSLKGDHAVTRVAQAIKKKTWRWTLLNLAWTAGPVTAVAIYIGHRFGFGSGPSSSQVIYFASYSLVVGVAAVAAGIIREAFYQPRIEHEKKRLTESIDRTYSLILHIRDLNLASLPINERKIMAAYYTLQSAGISPSAVKEAVYDLTASQRLTQAIERVSAFNEQGMQSLINDAWSRHQDDLQEVEEKLGHIAPAAYGLLLRRIKGDEPDARSGRPRDEGFIQRTLEAADENDPSLMTLTDAYEVATLAFELLNGRLITALEARFAGDHQIAKVKRKLDAAKKKYREALRSRNSAIRLLLDDIDSAGLIDRLPETARSGPTIIRTLVDDLRNLPEHERNRYRGVYEEVRNLHVKCVDAGKELLQAKQKYLTKVRKNGEKLSFSLKESDVRQAGFYIKPRTIQLDDHMKLSMSRCIENIPVDFEKQSEVQVKEIVMELATELDQLIRMSDTDVQAAIESSNAIQLGYLKPSYTAATKIGWASRVVKSMHESRRKAAHHLGKTLVAFYGIYLSDSVIKLLEEEFGADPEYLRALRQSHCEKELDRGLRIPEKADLPAWSVLND